MPQNETIQPTIVPDNESYQNFDATTMTHSRLSAALVITGSEHNDVCG
jgi:hypothetical protein